jgi:hypothetical protein
VYNYYESIKNFKKENEPKQNKTKNKKQNKTQGEVQKSFSNFTELPLLLFLCSIKKYDGLLSGISWNCSPP